MRLKIIISILLVFCMLASMMIVARAEDTNGSCGTNATWSYENGTLTISGTGAINDYSTNTAPWKNYPLPIKNLVIKEGITRIGTSAFYQCQNLTSVQLPTTLTNIGGSAFTNTKVALFIIKANEVTIDGAIGNVTPVSATIVTKASTMFVKKTTSTTTPRTAEAFFTDEAQTAQRKFSYVYTDFDNNGCQNVNVFNTTINPLSSADMSLGVSLAMNLYMTTTLDSSKLTVNFAIGNYVETDVAAISTSNANEVQFKLSNIAAHLMNDEIIAELFFDGIKIAEKHTSIKNYLEAVANTTQYANSDAMKTLVSDLLEYGAAAQQYKEHNVENLVNNSLCEYKSTYVPIDSSDKALSAKTNESVYLKAAGVSHADTNKIYVKIETNDIANTVVSINGTDVDGPYANVNGNIYVIYTSDILPTHFDDVFHFELKYNGTTVQTLDYSIKSYVYSKQMASDMNARLAIALYQYGQSAKAFVGA